MKKIIVGIDFSRDSVHALECGIMFANKIGSDLLMVWVDNISGQSTLLPYETAKSIEIKEEAKENLEELVKRYKKDLYKSKLYYRQRKGKVYQEIAYQAKASNADLVLTGAHGITGYEEYWVGSNAFRIVVSSPCPVITIRQSFQFDNNLDKIVLPIDNTPETIQKVPFTTQLASFFNSEMHLLTLFSTNIASVNRKTESVARQAAKYITSKGLHAYIEPVSTENVTNTTLHYGEIIKAGLVSIMTEQESASIQSLLGASAQQMINNSTIPVLSIQPNELFSL